MAYRRMDGVMCEGGEVGRVCILVVLLLDDVAVAFVAKIVVILLLRQNSFIFGITRPRILPVARMSFNDGCDRVGQPLELSDGFVSPLICSAACNRLEIADRSHHFIRVGDGGVHDALVLHCNCLRHAFPLSNLVDIDIGTVVIRSKAEVPARANLDPPGCSDFGRHVHIDRAPEWGKRRPVVIKGAKEMCVRRYLGCRVGLP